MAELKSSQWMLAEGGVELVQGLAILGVAGIGLALGALVFGRLIRPRRPSPLKGEPYECGEVPIGSSWVQFDLRFYVVALVFLIFDVEIALFWPWAVVFGGGSRPGASAEVLNQVRLAAMADMLFFFGVIVVGFLYLWRFGYLDWVRAYTSRQIGTERLLGRAKAPAPPPDRPAGAGV